MRPVVQLAVRAWAHLPPPRGPALMVVGYHRVADRDDHMTVRPPIFAKHISWLAADRAHVPIVEIDDAVRRPLGAEYE